MSTDQKAPPNVLQAAVPDFNNPMSTLSIRELGAVPRSHSALNTRCSSIAAEYGLTGVTEEVLSVLEQALEERAMSILQVLCEGDPRRKPKLDVKSVLFDTQAREMPTLRHVPLTFQVPALPIENMSWTVLMNTIDSILQ